MRRSSAVVGIIVLALLSFGAIAQEQPDPKTVLPPAVLNAIAAEVSGAQAHNHVLDMCGYEHNRPVTEYQGNYREVAYALEKAKEYGFSDVKVETFPSPGKQWDGLMGELWITEPGPARLITRYRDLPATLAAGSKDADVSAELTYVGRGDRESDYTGKDVNGKIVLVSGSVGAAHNLAVGKFGAAGVVSFYSGTGKPIDHPDQIGWSGISGRRGQGGEAPRVTFGFVLSHRMGMDLLALLEGHKKVVVHAVVKATEVDAPMQLVTATIPGNGSSAQEVDFVGHLFEGLNKQGANDNCSGPAIQLEIGRAWIKLIKDGILPRPKRTVRFLWVPEISGTSAYLRKYPEHAKNLLGVINMDMVGADQTKNHNSLHLDMTPYSLPTFLNDLGQQLIEYVGDTNREKVHNRAIAYSFMNPIVDPKGSHDPFWYHVEKYYGSSDHQVYIGARVPALMFGNWPDAVYHTSEDSPFFLDPTQMKRMAFIGLSLGDVLATAGPELAAPLAELTIGHAQSRIGNDLGNALGEIARSSNADELNIAYKEALNVVRQAYLREHQAVRSAATVAPADGQVADEIAQLDTSFGAGESVDVGRVRVAYRLAAKRLSVPAVEEPTLTEAENATAILFPKPKPGAQPQGGGRGPGGPGGQRAEPPLRGYYAMEARAWADGEHSILDIRNAISAEFGPVPVDNVLQFFKGLEAQGSFEIAQKQLPTAAPKKGGKKKTGAK